MARAPLVRYCPFVRRLSLAFAAGAAGGVVNSLAVWLAGTSGVAAALHVSIAPALTPAWLYPRVVWGGLWGFLLLVPLAVRGPIQRGLLLSLGPTLFQLFFVFPVRAHQGVLGLGLGTLTPVLVVVFNALWGITAVFWFRAAAGKLA